jgi:flagellar hook-basal body complex protein FliE
MSADNVQNLLSQMRVMSDMAAGQLTPVTSTAPTVNADGNDFQNLLRQAVHEVNQAQNSAQDKVQAFSTGESNMTLEEVMVSLQKANLSFQSMIAVRNRLVDAYKEVTNLQV